jgi:sortase A
MSRDLLDIYQRGCQKAAAWLNGPISKRDAEPFLESFREGSRKMTLLISQMRAIRFGEALEGTYRQARKRWRELALGAGAQAFRVGSVLLGTVATRRALFLAARHHEQSPVQAERRQKQHLLRALETSLWIAAAGTLGYCSFVYASTAVHQAQRRDIFNHSEAERFSNQPLSNPSAEVPNGLPGTTKAEGELLGFLDIPKIGLSSVVEEGSGPSILLRGIGHLPGTALPGEGGNVGLAAHLDSYIGELSKLHAGDILTFRSMNGTYDYDVISTHVIDATKETTEKIVSSSSPPILTLVSSFPLQSARNAAKQVVVVAREIPAGTGYALR